MQEFGKRLTPTDADYERVRDSFGTADLLLWCEWRRERRGADDPLLIRIEAELGVNASRSSFALHVPAAPHDAAFADRVADAVERELRRSPLSR